MNKREEAWKWFNNLPQEVRDNFYANYDAWRYAWLRMNECKKRLKESK